MGDDVVMVTSVVVLLSLLQLVRLCADDVGDDVRHVQEGDASRAQLETLSCDTGHHRCRCTPYRITVQVSVMESQKSKKALEDGVVVVVVWCDRWVRCVWWSVSRSRSLWRTVL